MLLGIAALIGAGTFTTGTVFIMNTDNYKIEKERKNIDEQLEVKRTVIEEVEMMKKIYKDDVISVEKEEFDTDNLYVQEFYLKNEERMKEQIEDLIKNKKEYLTVKQKVQIKRYTKETRIVEIMYTETFETEKQKDYSKKISFTIDNNNQLLSPIHFIKEEDKEEAIKKFPELNEYAIAVIKGKDFHLEGIIGEAKLNMKEIKKYMKEGYYQKRVSLTFDDGPSQYTKDILKTLKKHDAKATFFVTGKSLEEHPEVMKQLVLEGHTVGSHSWSHKNLPTLSKKEMENDFQKTKENIEKYAGVKAKLFRPPYGIYNDKIEHYAKKNGMEIALWNVDTLDWKTKNAKKIKEEIIKHVDEEKVILMHDLYKTTDEGLEKALTELKNKGYTFVPMEELY